MVCVPSQIASLDLTGQTSQITSALLFEVVETGFYLVSVYVTAPTGNVVSAPHLEWNDGYNDCAMVAFTATVGVPSGNFISGTNTLYCAESTTISFFTLGTSTGFDIHWSVSSLA